MLSVTSLEMPEWNEFSMENGRGGGVRRMDGRNWLIDNSFARNFANSIPYDISTILRSNFSFQIVTKLQWKLRVRKS